MDRPAPQRLSHPRSAPADWQDRPSICIAPEGEWPDREFGIGRQGGLLDPLAADQRAVERTEIADHQQPVALEQFRVPTANHGVGDRQPGVPTAADDHRQLQLDGAFAGLPTDDDQFCIHRSTRAQLSCHRNVNPLW